MSDEEIVKDFTALKLKCESNTKEIAEIKKKQDEYGQLLVTMQGFKIEQDHMKTDISEIKDTVKIIAEKPAKRWDLIVTTGIGALAGAFFGWAMSGFPGI